VPVIILSKGKIVQKGVHQRQERCIAIYLDRNLSGLSGKEVGNFFGISGVAITMQYNKFIKEMDKNKKLITLVKKLRNQILNS